MMSEFVITTENPAAYFPADYESVVVVKEVDGITQLNIMHTEDPTLPGDNLVFGTGPDGIPLPGYSYDDYKAIVPHGNNPDGSAVDYTKFMHTWSGWHPKGRLFGDLASDVDVERVFPVSDRPLDAEVRHKFFDVIGPARGWGFRLELEGAAPSRDPTARAIGVYSDPECTQFLWTTGAFQLLTSDWQVDSNGDPLQVWGTDSWDGGRLEEKGTWHIAMLLGSAQEGYETLSYYEDSQRFLSWDYNQSSGSAWVDTGATIIAQAGTVYRISDAAVAAALIPGQAIRLGDTAETTFTGVWAGGADYIEIDPFVQAAVGDVVWAWQ